MTLSRLIPWLIIPAYSLQPLLAEPAPITSNVVSAINTFASDIYGRLMKHQGSFVLSPFLIDTSLAMLCSGSRGETASQMEEALSYPNVMSDTHADYGVLLRQLNGCNTSGSEVTVVNSLFAQRGFKFLKPFSELLRREYGANLNEIDLTGWPNPFDPAKAALAREEINNWVASQTHRKIEGILPESLPGQFSRLILVNAIWFKGKWATPFDKARTKDAPFRVSSDKFTLVPTMHVTEEFGYAENDAFQVLELPYISNRLSMVIFLPKKDGGLTELESSLNSALIEQLCSKIHAKDVRVSFPRFKCVSEFDLRDPLYDMGMKDAFSSERADFSGITRMKPFFIEAVIHKAYVNVDEEGTEASAATTAILSSGFPAIFNANHPFLFLIRDNQAGVILFLGRVLDPSKQ